MAKVSAAGQLVRVAAAACVVLAIAGVLRYAGNVKSGSAVKNAAAIVKEQWKESSETAVEEQKTETTAQITAMAEPPMVTCRIKARSRFSSPEVRPSGRM